MLHGGPDALRFLPIDGLALVPFKYAKHILFLNLADSKYFSSLHSQIRK